MQVSTDPAADLHQKELRRACAEDGVQLTVERILRRCAGWPALACQAVRALLRSQAAVSTPRGCCAARACAPWGRRERSIKFNPADPAWADRDRFVLSAGHGSMLLYSLLHLAGYDLGMSELRNFRQWGSLTPGHPEYKLTPGVETTTGPLGQGLANGVGMALAERILAARFNQADFPVVDHRTYVIASDGDLMEGVSHESCSLAGHLGLGRLIVLYDDNGISIDGPTSLSFSEDVLARFEAYGWQTVRVDGYDTAAIERALAAAVADESRPSLIACRTQIGYGCAERQGTSKAHGEPLGAENVRLAKAAFGYAEDAHFTVAEARLASGAVLKAIVPKIPTLVGGSADLTPSNNTQPPEPAGHSIAKADFSGRYVRYGVREHGMGSIMNGMALHGGVRPYGGTFLIFSDYMRPSIRMAALMEIPVVFVFTHDSIGLGEDGPTHQPIEHLASLRAIPNLAVLRPADATETVEEWRAALTRDHGPTALVLTRQNLPVLDRAVLAEASGVARGAYVLADSEGDPEVLLISSGSEVHIALEARRILAERGVRARVVSIPSADLFEEQPLEYRDQVLPPLVRARVAVEAGATHGLVRYVGLDGFVVGLDRFGASAPYQTLYRELGITPEAVVEAARRVLSPRS